MRFADMIARRYCLGASGRLFARTLTIIAIVSLAIAVAASLLTRGMMQGFHVELERKLLGMSPHIVVSGTIPDRTAWQAWLQQQPNLFASRMLEGAVIAQPVGREGYADVGVRLRGLDAAVFAHMPAVQLRLQEDASSPSDALRGRDGLPGMLAGSEVMTALGMSPWGERGETLRTIAPMGMLDPTGNLQPLARNFVLGGAFHTGIFTEDSQLLLTTLREAERALGVQARESWALYVSERADIPEILAQARAVLGPDVQLSTWQERNQKLFAALAFEQRMMFAILLIMLVIAAVSIFAVVSMHMISRQRDLAVLAALGTPAAQLRRIVIRVGTWLGLAGASAGAACFLLVSWYLHHFPIILPPSFYVSVLPVRVEAISIALVMSGAIGIATLAAWYPAQRMRHFAPVQHLRAE